VLVSLALCLGTPRHAEDALAYPNRPMHGSAASGAPVFGDPVVATAILDRLLHHSHVITILGDSYRLKEKRRSGLLQKPAAAETKSEKKS